MTYPIESGMSMKANCTLVKGDEMAMTSKLWEIRRRRLAKFNAEKQIVITYFGNGTPNDDDWPDVCDAMAIDLAERFGYGDAQSVSEARRLMIESDKYLKYAR
jgi:hypothetical protein